MAGRNNYDLLRWLKEALSRKPNDHQGKGVATPQHRQNVRGSRQRLVDAVACTND